MSLDSILSSWYPLARSADLKKGGRQPLTLLGHELVLFRSLDNAIGVLRRHCPHMGGDLSRGRVTQTGLACPIHHWEFAPDGRRLSKRSCDRAQVDACQPSIPCIERWGLIFGFLGDEPFFNLPNTQSDVFCSNPAVRDMNINYTVPSLFGFDSEHFTTVHHRLLADMSIYENAQGHIGTSLKSAVGEKRWSDRILQQLGLAEVETDIDYWAGNIVFGRHSKTRTYALITTLPLDEHRSRIFVVTMQEKPAGGTVKCVLGWCRYQLARPLITAFIRQDEKALEGVRFNSESTRRSKTSAVNRWLSHVENLPSISTSQLIR